MPSNSITRRSFAKMGAVAACSALVGISYPVRKSFASDSIRFTPDVASEMAETFYSSMTGSSSAIADSVLPFYDDMLNPRGYEVQYSDGGDYCGYIVLDMEADGVIAEYSLNAGARGPLNRAKNALSAAAKFSNASDAILIKKSIFDYCAVLPDGSSIDQHGMLSQSAPLPRSTPGSWYDAFIDLSYYYTNYTPRDEIYVYPYLAMPDNVIMDNIRKWSCSVSASQTVLSTFGLIDDPYDSYEELFDLMVYDTYYDANYPGITLGTSNYDLSVQGILTYAARRASGLIDGRAPMNNRDVIWNLARGTSSENHASLLCATMQEGGHSVGIVGTSESTNNSSHASFRGLMALDGWDGQQKIINLYQSSMHDLQYAMFT